MGKDELKSVISAAIAGQGNQVDLAGRLAEILTAIVDMVPVCGSHFVELSGDGVGGVEVSADVAARIKGWLSNGEPVVCFARASEPVWGPVYEVGEDLFLPNGAMIKISIS